ncbi:MAG TPA: hypothetical protein VIW80_16490 [Pyrinomonadaceae bacterium]
MHSAEQIGYGLQRPHLRGRLPEALAALKRALELDEELAENLAEPDLKALAALPEFKKLLEERGAEEVGPSRERKLIKGTAPAP